MRGSLGVAVAARLVGSLPWWNIVLLQTTMDLKEGCVAWVEVVERGSFGGLRRNWAES